MKKFFAGLLLVLLTTLGLTTVSSQPASADPYPGTVPTTTNVKYRSSVRRTHKFSMKVNVSAAGNVKPTGTVACKVKRKKGGYKFSKSRAYTGGTTKIRTGRLKKTGRYSFTCTYQPPAGSVFQASSKSGSFKVRRAAADAKSTRPRRLTDLRSAERPGSLAWLFSGGRTRPGSQRAHDRTALA